MRHKIRIIGPPVLAAVLVAALTAVITLGAAKPGAAVGGASGATGAVRSLEVGLGIECGDDWISLNGMIEFLGDPERAPGEAASRAAGDSAAGAAFSRLRPRQAHVLRIGAFPNVARQAQKGYALFRTLGKAAACVLKHCLREWAAERVGKEGR